MLTLHIYTGDIIVQGDLTNELFDEYRLLVRAIDQVGKTCVLVGLK